MKLKTPLDLDALRNVDVRTVDPASLVDIQTTNVDLSLPYLEKAIGYINQIANPYCFLCDGVIVKVSYGQTETSMNDCMEGCFRSL